MCKNDDADLNRTGLPPGHRLYRRGKFLVSIPLPGEGGDLPAEQEQAEHDVATKGRPGGPGSAA